MSRISNTLLINGHFEYLITWTLPDGQTHKLWELFSKIENDALKLIKEFYKKTSTSTMTHSSNYPKTGSLYYWN